MSKLLNTTAKTLGKAGDSLLFCLVLLLVTVCASRASASENLTVTNTHTTTPTFSWTPTSPGQLLLISEKATGAYTAYAWVTGTSWVCTTALTVGKEYSWTLGGTPLIFYGGGVVPSGVSGPDFLIGPVQLPTSLSVSGCSTLRPTFSWTTNAYHTYDLEVKDQATSAVVYSATNATSPNTCSLDLTNGTAYRWFVRAKKDGTLGTWVEGSVFVIETTTDVTPPAPSTG